MNADTSTPKKGPYVRVFTAELGFNDEVRITQGAHLSYFEPDKCYVVWLGGPTTHRTLNGSRHKAAKVFKLPERLRRSGARLLTAEICWNKRGDRLSLNSLSSHILTDGILLLIDTRSRAPYADGYGDWKLRDGDPKPLLDLRCSSRKHHGARTERCSFVFLRPGDSVCIMPRGPDQRVQSGEPRFNGGRWVAPQKLSPRKQFIFECGDGGAYSFREEQTHGVATPVTLAAATGPVN